MERPVTIELYGETGSRAYTVLVETESLFNLATEALECAPETVVSCAAVDAATGARTNVRRAKTYRGWRVESWR